MEFEGPQKYHRYDFNVNDEVKNGEHNDPVDHFEQEELQHQHDDPVNHFEVEEPRYQPRRRITVAGYTRRHLIQ